MPGVVLRREVRPAGKWVAKVSGVIGDRTEISPSEVARRTKLKSEKITRIVDQLVARDLMRRNQKHSDKRRVSLTLTAKGRRVHRELETMRRAIETEFIGALDEWETRQRSIACWTSSRNARASCSTASRHG